MQGEEIFGPVVSIVRVPSVDAAIKLQNSSNYANGAAVYTSSGAVARHVVARLQAGMVGVNVGVPVPREPLASAAGRTASSATATSRG